jgi:hypothetical protein
MLYDVVYDAEQAMAQYLQENAEQVCASKLGLDARAGRVWVTEDAVVRQGHAGSLDYYGGFEYVDKEYVTQMGDYKVYFADDERVAECLERYAEHKQAA